MDEYNQTAQSLDVAFHYYINKSEIPSIRILNKTITMDSFFKKYDSYSKILGNQFFILQSYAKKAIVSVISAKVANLVKLHNLQNCEDDILSYKMMYSSWIIFDTNYRLKVVDTEMVKAVKNYIFNHKCDAKRFDEAEEDFIYSKYTSNKIGRFIDYVADLGYYLIELTYFSSLRSCSILKTDNVTCNFRQFSRLIKESFDSANINLDTFSDTMIVKDSDFSEDGSDINRFIKAFDVPFIRSSIRYLGFSEEVNTFVLNRLNIKVTYNKKNDFFKNVILKYSLTVQDDIHNEKFHSCAFKFKPYDVLSIIYGLDNSRANRKNIIISNDLEQFIMKFNELVFNVYTNENEIAI